MVPCLFFEPLFWKTAACSLFSLHQVGCHRAYHIHYITLMTASSTMWYSIPYINHWYNPLPYSIFHLHLSFPYTVLSFITLSVVPLLPLLFILTGTHLYFLPGYVINNPYKDLSPPFTFSPLSNWQLLTIWPFNAAESGLNEDVSLLFSQALA